MNYSWVSGGVIFVFWVYIFTRKFRPLNMSSLASEIGHERFGVVSRTWRSRFLTLQPTCILNNRRYQIWYFRTESMDGCCRESFMIDRFLFAPLHVFYVDGKVTGVKGGVVKFQILENEKVTKANLERLLKVVQAKFREVATNPILN